MRLLCPAKINLHLRVGRRRAADGFHPLLTWMATVGLFDTLTMEATARPPTGGVASASRGERPRTTTTPHLSGTGPLGAPSRHADEDPPSGRERAGATRILLLSSDRPGLPTDGSNLVVRAAEAFADAIAGSHGAGDVAGAASGRSDVGGQADAGSGSGASASLPVTADEPTSRGAGGRQPLRHREGLISPGGGGHGGTAPATRGVGEGVDAPRVATGTAGHRPAHFGGEAERAGPGVARVVAVLEKRIPLGAGLGGGSSDAARTLVGLDRLWQIGWPIEKLARIAGRLGSDVPFFLYGPSGVCTGRGEIVRPIAPPAVARWAVLVLPDIHMPTPAVYRRFDELDLGFDDGVACEPDWADWATLPAKELLAGLVNDLEVPAFELKKELGELRAALELKLARPVRMSGSGSSLFTLFDDRAEAEAAAGLVSGVSAVRATAVEVAPAGANDELNGTALPA